MKNLFKVIAFSFVLLAGMNTMNAQSLKQDKERPETKAKMEVAELSKSLDLSGEQQRTIFRALVTRQAAYKKHVTGKTPSESLAQKKKIDNTLDETMKKALTKAQYDKWRATQVRQ